MYKTRINRMSQIKLEVGKAYRNRSGGIVTIVAENPGELMQFVDSAGESYRSDARSNILGHSTPSDLIEEFTHFQTQQEIYLHLAHGGYVKDLLGRSFLVGFNVEGILCRYDLYGTILAENSWYFAKPSDWTIAVPKVPNWYDNIPEQGVLCWCKEDGMEPVPRIIVEYFAGTAYPFRTKDGSSHAYAVPATLEELAKIHFGEQT